MKKLIAVKGYRVRYLGQDFTEGCTLKEKNGTCTITLATHVNAVGAISERGVYNILLTLAHELAHLKEWDHTPKHWKLEARLCYEFAHLLDKTGVPDINCLGKDILPL